MSTEIEDCIGCGLRTLKLSGDVHSYMLSSRKCWSLYGEVLAREYSDPDYMFIHALTVDAYALQHPGDDNPQAVSSIYIHLLSLYAYFEKATAVIHLPMVKKQVAKHSKSMPRLLPPDSTYDMHVSDVLSAKNSKEHINKVIDWAKRTYVHWAKHHQLASELYKKWVLE